MAEFPRSIKDGNIELSKLEPTFKLAQEIFHLVDTNRKFFEPWLDWVQYISKPEDEFDYIKKVSKTDNGSYHVLYNDKLVGNIGFVNFSETNKCAEIGYWLDKNYNGHGIMTKSVKQLEKLAFHGFDFNRIEIRVDVLNLPSQRVAERCNYVRDGILRQAVITAGKPCDVIVYSKLKSEYEKGK